LHLLSYTTSDVRSKRQSACQAWHDPESLVRSGFQEGEATEGRRRLRKNGFKIQKRTAGERLPGGRWDRIRRLSADGGGRRDAGSAARGPRRRDRSWAARAPARAAERTPR